MSGDCREAATSGKAGKQRGTDDACADLAADRRGRLPHERSTSPLTDLASGSQQGGTFPPRLPAVPNRASSWNLALSLVGYALFMTILLVAIGSGVGTVELTVWLGILAVGILLIVRRYRSARAGMQHPSGS